MINAAAAASSGINYLDVTARIAPVSYGLMSAVMKLAIEEECAWVVYFRRIDGIRPDRPTDGIASRPSVEPACNLGLHMKIVRLASRDRKPIVAGGVNGSYEQLLWFVKNKSARTHCGFLWKSRKIG